MTKHIQRLLVNKLQAIIQPSVLSTISIEQLTVVLTVLKGTDVGRDKAKSSYAKW